MKPPVAAPPISLHALREVRVPVHRHRAQESQWFYAELLSFAPWPDAEQPPGGLGLGRLRRGLHLVFAHDADVDPVRRGFSLASPRLDLIEQRLQEAAWPFEVRNPIGASRVLVTRDPCGNRLEICSVQPL